MAIAGTITLANPGSPKPWAAHYASGKLADLYASMRDAQLVIEAAFGGKLLNWVRDDLGSVESYRATV